MKNALKCLTEKSSAAKLKEKSNSELKTPTTSDGGKPVSSDRRKSIIADQKAENKLKEKSSAEWKKPITLDGAKPVTSDGRRSIIAEQRGVGSAEQKIAIATERKKSMDRRLTAASMEVGSVTERKPSTAERQTSRVSVKRSSVILGSSMFDPQFGDVWTKKQNNRIIRYICWYFHKKPAMFTPAELEEQIHKLHKFCLIHLQDSYRVHLNRLKGIALLDEITERTKIEYLTPIHVMSLIWCALSCIHHFYIRLTVSRGLMAWARRRQARRAMRTYEKLISLVMPHMFGTVMRAIMTFYCESKMWNTEYLCAELLKRLLYISQQGEGAVHAILDTAEKTSTTNIREARQVIRVLYQVLENYPWQDIEETLITRLLTMYQRSIMPCNDNFDYVPLQKGLEVCLRHIIENLPSVNLLKIIRTMVRWTFDDQLSDEALLDFGNVLEYAAMLHHTYLYRDSLYYDLFPMIMQLVASENRLHSLLGNRVLQHLMDRHCNRPFFDTPRIFFDDMHFDIRVSQYNSEDKSFIRKYREMLHTALLTSIELHGVHRINLESTYASIAIIVVEIPCGYTAAVVVCLAMAIQEYALAEENLELECSHRLHATVLAIMSLVCWVHSAQVFYDYMKKMVSRRAQFAPHLNPPLRAQYQYAQHHILWNKPELFFEDWEARYGLWKCFRTRRARNGTITAVKNSSQHDL